MNASETDQEPSTRHYFVDEAGDGILFNRKKRTIIGTDGCSKFFILGLLDVSRPAELAVELDALRNELLNDAYLASVPSMQPTQRKTAVAFHAKDDCPEVRREVFRLLMAHEMRFYGIVRWKDAILRKVLERNQSNPTYRYHPNQLYDRCVSRLFRDRLHKDDAYVIQFAKRGNRDRTDALKQSLEHSRSNFRRKWGIEAESPIEVIPISPQESAGIQAVDYFLWALQRLYERREDRYWEFVASRVSLVHDVDDVRENDYGAYYTKRNPLTLAALTKVPGI